MESGHEGLSVHPPWQNEDFFSEAGLREAQEYFFQTHAASSRRIAEGRAAQGLSKSFARRKLSREIGDDFKMYTGAAIGQEAPQESAGIRGELNQILEHIYKRVAPNQPIISPIQEDLTIIGHPHGGLEVCYAMVFYYNSLIARYSSLAGQSRKTLRAIMDEELFKWVWRTVIAFMMSPPEKKTHLEDSHLCGGLRQVPPEKQRVPMGQKLYEVGMFLLSKVMQESHLRYPIAHYFVIYIRQMQTALLMRSERRMADQIYQEITKHQTDERITNPLVAIDLLMNLAGNSTQSFDDVLANPPADGQEIPLEEMEFINQFEDFGNAKRLAATLRQLIPDPRKEELQGGADPASMMPVLLLLRTMPVQIREEVLKRMPGPMMIMLINRINNSPRDDVSKELMDRLKEAIEFRRKSGEKYTLATRSVGTTATYQGSVVGEAPGKSPMPSERPASDGRAPAAGGGAPAGAGQAAGEEASPAEAEAANSLASRRLVVAWGLNQGHIVCFSLSAEELVRIGGTHSSLLTPFVSMALRTGQIFGRRLEHATPEQVERTVDELKRKVVVESAPLLGLDKLSLLLERFGDQSAAKFLQGVIKASRLPSTLKVPEELAGGFANVEARFPGKLGEFLRQPSAEEFRAARASLTEEEKETLGMLQRVLRAQ